MGRHACSAAGVQQKLRKGLWSPEEDEKLYNHIYRYGVGCWSSVPKLAGLQRCGKSCRLRWLNYLRPDIRHGAFTDEEDAIITSLYSKLGSKWSTIAAQLERRTDNDVKNHWNTKLKRRLAAAAACTPLLPLPAPPPLAATHTSPSSSLLLLPPLAVPTVKTEAYTCDDFLQQLLPTATAATALRDPFADGAATDGGSTSASAASSGSNWSADTGVVVVGGGGGGGLFPEFCMSSDDLAGAATAEDDHFIGGGYYYPLDPSLSSSLV